MWAISPFPLCSCPYTTSCDVFKQLSSVTIHRYDASASSFPTFTITTYIFRRKYILLYTYIHTYISAMLGKYCRISNKNECYKQLWQNSLKFQRLSGGRRTACGK